MIDWDIVLFIVIVAVLVGLLVLAYLVTNDKLKPPFKRPGTYIVNGFWTALLLLIAGTMSLGIYEHADKNGWFAHKLKVSVFMHDDWLLGEFQSCMLGGNRQAPLLYCGDSINALAKGLSGMRPETRHDMNVEFRSSIDALDIKKRSDWVCQREQLSIACKKE